MVRRGVHEFESRSGLVSASENAWLRASFWCYLAAVAGLGVRWLSPLSAITEQAILSDVLVAAASGIWLIGLLVGRRGFRIRVFHLALALVVGATCLSAAFAADTQLALENVLLTLELVAIALLTSYFAADARRLRWIVWAVCASVLVTAVLAAVGLALFYADVKTGLTGAYGEQFIANDTYARVQAGFYSPPLLASYCIFASAVIAREDVPIPHRVRLAAQIALGALVIATLSRAVLGFAAALIIRAAARRPDSVRWRSAAIATVVGAMVAMAALTAGRLHLDPTRPGTISYEVPDPGNRAESFVASVETLGDHPIVGEGPGTLVGENRGQPFRAHFTPLNIAATVGLPALAAFTFLIVTLWRRRRRPTPIATWSGLAGLGIDGLGQDIEHFRHVWVLLGLADHDRERSAEEAVESGPREPDVR